MTVSWFLGLQGTSHLLPVRPLTHPYPWPWLWLKALEHVVWTPNRLTGQGLCGF